SIGGQLKHAIGNLIDRVLLYDASAFATVGYANAREQQPEIVIDLRRRTHSGTGRPRRIPLPYRNGRRDPADLVDFRFFDSFEKLPRVGGQGFDIPPLALGINGVEGERR